MASDKKQFNKVTTFDGRTFYTDELDRSKLMILEGVKRIEDAWMTQEEFYAIPASAEAQEFFSGRENVRGRSAAAAPSTSPKSE